jgi:hypothetical protein
VRPQPLSRQGTIFIGCGFAAKYPEGGGNFSVPLQWALGLRRLKADFIWLEFLSTTGDPRKDARNVRIFQRRIRDFGFENRYCLMLSLPPPDEVPLFKADPEVTQFFGMSRQELEQRLAGPNTLLNLSWSIRDPLVERFERRIYCSLDPSEIYFWMSRLEMGQSFHHEFWTIGLAFNEPKIRLKEIAPAVVAWKTFYPLVDTEYLQPAPRPQKDIFTTVGQWYWDGYIDIDGVNPDFSKKAAMEQFFALPRRVPDARFELAIWLNADDVEANRVEEGGWKRPRPQIVARTPARYYNYIRRSLAEFTPVKLDRFMQSGWLSDRAAVYLALGRPVITEPTNADKYLPSESGFLFVRDLEEAVEAVGRVRKDWRRLSKAARVCAREHFDSVKNLKLILS